MNNYSGQDIIVELSEKQVELKNEIENLPILIKAMAQSERTYRVESAIMTLRLKDEGKAITLIDTLVKGDTNVSLLRMQRDIDEAMYRTSIEKIHALKLEIRVLSQFLPNGGMSNEF